MSRRNTRNLRPFIGKTISGIVETSQDEDEGRIQIQFTDGSAVEFEADSSSGSPWLNVDPVETEFPTGTTEDGNPVQDRQIHPAVKRMLDGNPVQDRQIHPAIKKMLDMG